LYPAGAGLSTVRFVPLQPHKVRINGLLCKAAKICLAFEFSGILWGKPELFFDPLLHDILPFIEGY